MITFIFWFIATAYLLHSLGLLPLCPFCRIRVALITFMIKNWIKQGGIDLAHRNLISVLQNSSTTLWVKIYDEITCTKYEEETEEEQIPCNSKAEIVTEEIKENPYKKEIIP